MKRREARSVALELLFEYDFNRDKTTEQIIDDAIEAREIKINSFAKLAFTQAANNLEMVDKLISEKAQNWKLDRISKLAKAIMRLCVAEIVFVGTPDRIAINEAVELAKFYDDEKGVQFINGVLGGVVRALPGYEGEPKPLAEDDEGEVQEEE